MLLGQFDFFFGSLHLYIYMYIYIYIYVLMIETCLILNCLLAFPRHVHPTTGGPVPRLRLAAARSAGASERRRTNSLAPGPWR